MSIGSSRERILFLCFGNICRSPFAERYWNDRIEREGQAAPRAISAGFHETPRRRTPPEFIGLAAEFGVDLARHRSRVVSDEIVASCESIYLMDQRNRDDLARAFPDRVSSALLLGSFGPEPSTEIADPWGKDPAVARACYRQLASALDGLWERLWR